MAQRRYWNWQDDDSTFDLNWRDLGIIPHGLYSGFDGVLSATLNLTLNHATTGITKTKQDLTLSPSLGIHKTRQGVVVVEDGSIVLPISAGDPTNPRYDLIVAEHEYTQVIGGSNCLYKVIQGTPGSPPVIPALTFPTKQVILGVLYVPAGMTNLFDADVEYIREQTPDFAGKASYFYKLLDVDYNTAPVTNAVPVFNSAVAPSGKWQPKPIATLIAGTHIKMAEAVELNAIAYSGVSFPVITTLGALKGINLPTTANSFFFNYPLVGGPIDYVDVLPDTWQLGTILNLAFGGDMYGFNLNATAPAGWLPFKMADLTQTSGLSAESTFLPGYRTFQLIRRSDCWEIVDHGYDLNKKANKAITFTNLTLNTGYTTFMGNTVKATKDGFGFVHLQGAFTVGIGGTVITTLPVGMRPQFFFNKLIADNVSNNGVSVGVDTNGDIILHAGNSGSSYYLTGISFFAS